MSTDTLDFDMNFEDGQQSEADRRLLVKFTLVPTHQEFESIKEGRPVYKDEEVIQIMIPGSRNVIASKVNPSHRQRFAKQYAAFKAGQAQAITGTPLSVLVWMTPAQQAEFGALNVKTVEQLATLPDNVAHRFMGAQAIKQRAQAYLDSAKDQAPMLRLQAELETRDEQIAQMQAQIQELIAAAKPKVPIKAT
jgi:uncharacterized protein YunC (DUF1805 family)